MSVIREGEKKPLTETFTNVVINGKLLSVSKTVADYIDILETELKELKTSKRRKWKQIKQYNAGIANIVKVEQTLPISLK